MIEFLTPHAGPKAKFVGYPRGKPSVLSEKFIGLAEATPGLMFLCFLIGCLCPTRRTDGNRGKYD